MAYAQILTALADSTRRAVFERLRRGPLSVGRLAEGLAVTRPAVSQHLRVLEAAGLVSVRREGTRRIYSVKASAAELQRAMRDLKLPGAMIFSNINGVGLDDERFWPVYEAANDLDAVIMIHPTFPLGVEAMEQYWLMPLNGFLFDTTLAASKLVFSGVVKRYPRIRWILAHLGGTIPYLAERLDRGWRAFKDCRAHIDEPPTTYLKKHFWYDTVNFSTGPLMLAIDFAGVDRILAGSDYPHKIGSIPLMKESIQALPISESDKAKIYGENAAALLGV
jgi:aminocarboxymuconate-semialdehyde decarboxylase